MASPKPERHIGAIEATVMEPIQEGDHCRVSRVQRQEYQLKRAKNEPHNFIADRDLGEGERLRLVQRLDLSWWELQL